MFLLAKVVSVDVNDAGEVTAAKCFKRSTREVVYRHASTIIPLIEVTEEAPGSHQQGTERNPTGSDTGVLSPAGSDTGVPGSTDPGTGQPNPTATLERSRRNVRPSREAARSKISAWRADNLI